MPITREAAYTAIKDLGFVQDPQTATWWEGKVGNGKPHRLSWLDDESRVVLRKPGQDPYGPNVIRIEV